MSIFFNASALCGESYLNLSLFAPAVRVSWDIKCSCFLVFKLKKLYAMQKVVCAVILMRLFVSINATFDMLVSHH